MSKGDEKWLRVSVPARLRPYLRALLRTGIYGSTEDAVAITLMEMQLREDIKHEYLRKAKETRDLLNSALP